MAKRRSSTTPVIFRKDPDGTVFAIFPSVLNDCKRMVGVYQHVGQHGGGDYMGMMRSSKPARPAEYASLATELRSVPFKYRLQIVERRTKTHVSELNKEYDRMCSR